MAEALEDSASFRRFCSFAAVEPTPERTAFVRFRRALVRRGLDEALFDAVTDQLKRQAIRVKTGALVDATVIASPSRSDDEAGWSGHRSRKAIHSYKAHVGADVDTAIVGQIGVTPGNARDGRNGERALPDDPGDVFADSAYWSQAFAGAVRAQGGTPRVVMTGIWAKADQASQAEAERRMTEWNSGIQHARGRIEKVFDTRKRSYGLRRKRWRGLLKAGLQIHLTAIAYNLRRTASFFKTA